MFDDREDVEEGSFGSKLDRDDRVANTGEDWLGEDMKVWPDNVTV